VEEETKDQIEAQTVGELLRNTRIKQGKELREVAEVLCIRSSYLDAIENMDIKNIPPAPYGTGFIRSYAELLGLNSERILSSYRQSLYGISEQDKKPQEKNVETSGPRWHHVLWGIIGLGLLAYAWIEFPLSETNDTVTDFENTLETTTFPEPVIIDETEIISEENTTLDSAIAEAESNLQKSTKEETLPQQEVQEPQEKPTPTNIKMVFSGPSWVELKRNGKVVLSRTMQRGKEYIIEDAENATITVGRFRNVKFFIDDKEVKIVTAQRSRNVALKDFIKTKNQE
jgi:cytoskeleton protein RodZ